MTYISGYIWDQHINIVDSHINMVDEPGNWYSTKEDKIKFEMNKNLLFWLSQKQYVGHWGFKLPRSGITRHPAQISTCSLKLGPPVSFFFPLSFLPSFQKLLRDIGNAFSLPLSVPHPILYAPSQNFHSRAHSPTKKGHNGNALSCWILKMFLKNPLKNNFKPKHYIFIEKHQKTQTDTKRSAKSSASTSR